MLMIPPQIYIANCWIVPVTPFSASRPITDSFMQTKPSLTESAGI
jgi:hypothetical protein